VTGTSGSGAIALAPDPPELPVGAGPQWPPWFGFAAMGAGTIALIVVVIPVVPVLLFAEAGGASEAIALLVLVLLQDATYVGTAVGFAFLRRGVPRPWHFGLRATALKRTVLIAVGATLVIFGFELGYVELLGMDETNVDDLGGGADVIAALAVSLTVIVVAPVTEELFFRAFFYRALRNRFRTSAAALIDGTVFGALHFEGWGTVEILPVIAFFGVGVCLVYEATGNVFAPIAIHSAFNTLATAGTDAGYVIPVLVGLAVVGGCLAAPRVLGPAPSPFSA
jgi:membrane protease YdiL (CAAX protease family)